MSQVPIRRDQFFNLIQDTYGDKAFRGEYDGSNNLIYAGFALPGSSETDRVWQIKRLGYSGTNLVIVDWAELNGSSSTTYNFAWSDRAIYVYS
jgi:hypothetical protein